MASLIAIFRSTPPALGTCRSCAAPIEWVDTTQGKRMPCDAPLQIAKQYERLDGLVQIFVDVGASHFATCPDAPRFRKGRR